MSYGSIQSARRPQPDRQNTFNATVQCSLQRIGVKHMNVDKNKIRDSVQKARLQDLLYVTVNPTDKDSKKNALAEIDKFIGKGTCEITVIRDLRN
jgi:hypothetical protein